MRSLNRFLSFLIFVSLVGCGTVPEPRWAYDEQVVLRVWDTLDLHYGSDSFFECEFLPVVNCEIRIIKPYRLHDITVAEYSPSANEVRLFRSVASNPSEYEVVVEGTSLIFHPCHENDCLFVAWMPDVPDYVLQERQGECRR